MIPKLSFGEIIRCAFEFFLQVYLIGLNTFSFTWSGMLTVQIFKIGFVYADSSPGRTRLQEHVSLHPYHLQEGNGKYKSAKKKEKSCCKDENYIFWSGCKSNFFSYARINITVQYFWFKAFGTENWIWNLENSGCGQFWGTGRKETHKQIVGSTLIKCRFVFQFSVLGFWLSFLNTEDFLLVAVKVKFKQQYWNLSFQLRWYHFNQY